MTCNEGINAQNVNISQAPYANLIFTKMSLVFKCFVYVQVMYLC